MAIVTALRPGREAVAVELDGKAWRTLPIAAAVDAGLGVGLELDRNRARVLARSLRRLRAERIAVRAVARRDHSRSSLEARLARAGVGNRAREEVLRRAEREGLVDDVRFAERRAALLVDRGAGDLMIVEDLLRNGVADAVAHTAVASLPPESDRAAHILERRGPSVRTLRYLASRGFSEETLEPLIAEIEGGKLR